MPVTAHAAPASTVSTMTTPPHTRTAADIIRALAATAPAAGHIRGRVRRERRTGGREHYWYEVWNTQTGQLVISSDEFTFEAAMESAAWAVTIARNTWNWDLDAKDLGRSRAKKLTLSLAEAQSVMTWAIGGQPYGADRLMGRLAAALGN